MTIKDLRDYMKDYPDDQFVHIRIWFDNGNPTQQLNKDIIISKFQQGVSGDLLITGTIKIG